MKRLIAALMLCATAVEANRATALEVPSKEVPNSQRLRCFPALPHDVQDDSFLPDITLPYLSLEGAWPKRIGDVDSRGHGVVVALDATPTMMRAVTLPVGANREPDAEELSDIRALNETLGTDAAKYKYVLEGLRALQFEATRNRPRRGIGIGPGPEAGPFSGPGGAGLTFKTVSGTEIASPEGKAAAIELQRAWFVWYDALNADGKPDSGAAKRAALIMPGMFGNPEPTIDRLVQRLRSEGFGVLRMLGQPSRFTQRIEFKIDTTDLPGSASHIAAVLGDRAAECAYAAELAWDHVEKNRPGVGALPKAILGMSGGAITLPTVYARHPGRYRAAIIMAGSADFWLTNELSNYRQYIDAIRSRWSTPPTNEQRAELDRLYLAASPLDNFHTAGTLRAMGKRALIMQGLIDQATPAPLGDVLWERAGRPERWTYPVGHELFFAALPQEFDRITKWLNEALAPEAP